MSQDSFTRRGFLSGIAAVGGTTLLSHPAHATTRKEKDGAAIPVRPVADKVTWKAQAFPMEDVRLLPGLFLETMETNRGYLYSLPNDRLAYKLSRDRRVSHRCDTIGRLGGADRPSARPSRGALSDRLRVAVWQHRRQRDSRQGQRLGDDTGRMPTKGWLSRRLRHEGLRQSSPL